MEPEQPVFALGATEWSERAGLLAPSQSPARRAANTCPSCLRDQAGKREATLLEDTAEWTWGLRALGLQRTRFTGRGIRIAILDTGLDPDHPDFAGRPLEARSFLPRHAWADTHGHGTHCAGTAAGPREAAAGPRYGVAPEAEVHIARVLDDHGRGTDSAVLSGIDWAVRQSCVAASLSLGTPVIQGEPYSRVYEIAARRALSHGTLLIAAAGNDSDRPEFLSPLSRPANCPSVLSVGALGRSLRVASFSNAGLDQPWGSVDLAAPGVSIHSAWSGPVRYRRLSGTSMATPHVAGIAALWAEAHGLRGQALWDALKRSARPLPAPAIDVGAGLARPPRS